MGGGGQGSSRFKRDGTGVQNTSYSVPARISDLITSQLGNISTDTGLGDQQTALFSRLMQETPESQPGFGPLSTFANQSATGYPGKATLDTVANRNPYDSSYENATDDAFRQRAGDAMAQVASGPDAVRGGDARTGIAQGVMATQLAQQRGQEVRQAQLQDLMGVLGAANTAASVEGQRANTAVRAGEGVSNIATGVASRGLDAAKATDFNKIQNLALLQLATQLQGSQVSTQTDHFDGHGNQSGWSTGLQCCWTFLQAYNGKLPWFVELARYDFYTPQRRLGYKWMSSWLVPLMRRSRFVAKLVNAVLVKPATRYCAWYYGEPTATWRSALLAPYCKAWLALWGWLGRRV